MVLNNVTADCSFVEREKAISECIEIAKAYKTIVRLTVYKDCVKNKVVLTLTKQSRKDNVLRYVEKFFKLK